jgi:acetate kinase
MPAPGNRPRVLTINTGSSSLKAALIECGADFAPVATFAVERIGDESGRASITIADQPAQSVATTFTEHRAALAWLVGQLRERDLDTGLAGVGHRVVHGGPDHVEPESISPDLIADLRALIPIDPEHLPQAIAAIEGLGRHFPDLHQIACFDTWFHRTMPQEATMLPLPASLDNRLLRRYGFHGLSYESIMAQLQEIDPQAAMGRIVIAHLGAGASMVAISDGQSRDTTMGFSPTGGLMMGTRPGDLDPGVLLYLLQERGLSPTAINHFLNQESGLLGVSGTSQDMRELLDREDTDERAANAIALYCHIARKHLAALMATVGGLDTLIFTGGIGQNAPPIRARICDLLAFLGVEIDIARNAANDSRISTDAARVTVRVIKTDEERTLARHTAALVLA